MKNKMEDQTTTNDFTPEQLASSSLLSYIGLHYPKYNAEGMHKLIATALEAVEAGKIRRLLINCPPQHGKTMVASEYFPAWILGRHPDWKIIAATYNQTRANEVGTVVRDTLISSVHKNIFPNCVISPLVRSTQHVATTQRGHYYSVGVGGTGTGRGSNLCLIDDPIKGRDDAESKINQRKLRDWYRTTIKTRLRPDNRIVIIQTRWCNFDLTSFVQEELAHENWKIIKLPAIAEENDVLGRKEGEALCPKMYSIDYLKNEKIGHTTYDWEALYQQRPIAREGGIIKYKWFNYYTELPPEEEIIKIVISWDTAQKEEELHDPTAGTVWAVTKNGYYLIDVCNKKMEFGKLVRKVKELHGIHGATAHLIEDRGSGISLIQELKRTTTIPVIKISTKNLNKAIRLDAVSGIFEAGKVWFPEKAHWLNEAKDQLCLFPYKHDDITDSVSQFLNWVVNKPVYVRKPANQLYWK